MCAGNGGYGGQSGGYGGGYGGQGGGYGGQQGRMYAGGSPGFDFRGGYGQGGYGPAFGGVRPPTDVPTPRVPRPPTDVSTPWVGRGPGSPIPAGGPGMGDASIMPVRGGPGGVMQQPGFMPGGGAGFGGLQGLLTGNYGQPSYTPPMPPIAPPPGQPPAPPTPPPGQPPAPPAPPAPPGQPTPPPGQNPGFMQRFEQDYAQDPVYAYMRAQQNTPAFMQNQGALRNFFRGQGGYDSFLNNPGILQYRGDVMGGTYRPGMYKPPY